MAKNWMAVFLIVFALGTVAFAAYNYLELYRKDIPVSPSSEALSNQFLALERWLGNTGVKARNLYSPQIDNILAAGEKTVFVPASLFAVETGDYSRLDDWVESGTDLIVFIDVPELMDQGEPLGLYLSTAGIWGTDNRENSENWDSAEYEESAPGLDETMSFRTFKPGGEIVKTVSGIPGLLRLKKEQGSICVTGIPFFMYSDFIGEEPNAALAWALTGGSPRAGSGMLFVLPSTEHASFFGRFAEHGNWLPLLLSAGLLIIVAFWAALAPFGIVREPEESAGRPIADRFLSEAWFLARNRSLGAYLSEYREIISAKLRKETGRELGRDELIAYLCSKAGTDPDKTEQFIRAGENISLKTFRELNGTIEQILESI